MTDNQDDSESSLRASENRLADERPRKRNKQVIACDQCQKRKSRCELITEQGCRRCVVLKTACSLLPVNVDMLTNSSQTAESTVLASPQAAATSDSQRLQRIEQAILELTRISKNAFNDAGQLQNHRAKRPYDGAVGIDQAKCPAGEHAAETQPTASVALNWSQLAQELPQLCSIARIASVCMGMQPISRFPDPVEEGIVSMMEMECVYSKFKEDFGRLLPVSDYLFGCSVQQLPAHPFIRAAILHHVAARAGRAAVLSRPQCLRIYDCIQDHLLAVQSAEPSRDILRALLILSHCSNRQHSPIFVVPDSCKAATLAYDMAKDLCLDSMITKLPALRPADLKEEWNRQLLDNAALWYAIAHRHIWIKLLKSVGVDTEFSSDRSISNTISSVFLRETKSEILEHLFAESTLLEIINPLVPHFRKYIGHFASPYNPVDYEEGLCRMEAAHARFTIWRADHRSSLLRSMEELLTSSYYVQFCLCMKASVLINNLPKPLNPDLMGSLQYRASQALIACAADLLERIAAVKINFDTIPHYFLDFTFLPLGMARSFNMADMASDDFILSRKTLDYVSKRLRAAHPSIPLLLPRFDTAISGLEEETFTPSETSTQTNRPDAADQDAWHYIQQDATFVPQPLPEFLQGMLHSDFAAWPTSLEPFGLGTMMWPGTEAAPPVMAPMQFSGNNI